MPYLLSFPEDQVICLVPYSHTAGLPDLIILVIRIQNTAHVTKNVFIDYFMFSVRLPVISRLLVVNFEKSKSYMWVFDHRAQNP